MCSTEGQPCEATARKPSASHGERLFKPPKNEIGQTEHSEAQRPAQRGREHGEADPSPPWSGGSEAASQELRLRSSLKWEELVLHLQGNAELFSVSKWRNSTGEQCVGEVFLASVR